MAVNLKRYMNHVNLRSIKMCRKGHEYTEYMNELIELYYHAKQMIADGYDLKECKNCKEMAVWYHPKTIINF